MSFVDPYFDENIGDLRNLLNAKELKELEPQIVFANELELESVLIQELLPGRTMHSFCEQTLISIRQK